MLAEERIEYIKKYLLKEKGYIKVDLLSKMLKVSQMTIRRDLKKCEDLNILKRCHGGATLVNEITPEVKFIERQFLNIEIKRKIAKYCLKMVKKNMVVYLDAGSTTWCIAKEIKNIPNISVITNDINIAKELSTGTANIFLLGGTIQKSSGSSLGEITTNVLKNMRAQIAFVGSASINNNLESMTPTIEKVYLRQTICKISNSNFLVVDKTKFRTQSIFCVNSLSEYTGVITDMVFTEKEKKIIKEKKINIIKI